MDIARGVVQRKVEAFQTFILHPITAQLGTSGIQYSPVVTISTTEVEVYNQLLKPDVQLALTELELGLTQRFIELTGGTTSGSLMYSWKARSEWDDPVGTLRITSYCGLSPTLAKGVASKATSEDTVSGYIAVGSIPNAPLRLVLTAKSLYASAYSGEIKNDSYVRMVGVVVPGA